MLNEAIAVPVPTCWSDENGGHLTNLDTILVRLVGQTLLTRWTSKSLMRLFRLVPTNLTIPVTDSARIERSSNYQYEY